MDKTTKKFVGVPIGAGQQAPAPAQKEGILTRAAKGTAEFISERANLDFALGVANAIGQGVTFGNADEAIGFIASLGGADYEEVRDAIRKNLAGFREEDPVFAYGFEIGSSLFTPGGVVKALGTTGLKALATTAKQAAIKNPLTAAGVGGAVYGAGAAERAEDVPMAAATGAAFGAGGQALAPTVQAGARALQKAGIPVTPGQLFGRGTKRMEEGLQSLPIVGTGIRQAREGAIEAFSPYMFNRALKPIGVQIPITLKPRAAFQRARAEFNKKYEKTLGDVSIDVTDDVLDDLSASVATAKTNLGAAQASEATDLENFVLREVLNRAQSGKLSGTALKEIQTKIFRETSAANRAGNLKLADAYDEVDASLLSIFTKYSPEKATDLRALDKAYANYVPLRRAAAQAEEGGFTPARLMQAVKAEERREGVRGLGRLAAGEARMQGPIERAKRVIGAELPDSGTAERLGSMAVPILATTGVGALGGMATGATDLGAVLGAGAGLGALMGGRFAYTPAGQGLMRGVMIPAYSGTLRSPATAGLLAQPTAPAAQSMLLGE